MKSEDGRPDTGVRSKIRMAVKQMDVGEESKKG